MTHLLHTGSEERGILVVWGVPGILPSCQDMRAIEL